MDDFEIKKTGELDGFDKAENSSSESGYTVTPEGGFYTKQKADIIQDEVITPPHINNSDTNTGDTFKSEPQKQGNVNYSYNPYSYTPPQKPKKVKKPKQKRSYSGGIIVLASVLAAVIGAVSATVATATIFSENNSGAENKSNEIPGNNVNINIDKTVESVVEAVAEKVSPSVVGIRTTISVMNFFYGTSESSGDGSGVVYSSDGYIITNYHVIGDAITNKSGSKIEVFLDSASSKAYTATVVGYNISADLAVIKIDATGLTPIEVADSKELKVGQYVITVGNPGGLEFMDSVTYGVISGLNRVVSADSGVELIQTDAAINPGNSGGALVNTKGQLVGINSSKIVSEQFEGMGFAIPSNTVMEICKNIIEKENSPEPFIGISISERYTSAVLKYYGYPSGAVVLSVAEGSPAETSGIRRGDIITEFDGKEITEYQVLEQLMESCVPDQSVSVKIYRSGRYYTTTIKVGANNQVD